MATTNEQPGHSLVVTTLVELLGVGLFTILAGINDDAGSVMVVIMWGILLGWMLLHTTQLAKLVGEL